MINLSQMILITVISIFSNTFSQTIFVFNDFDSELGDSTAILKNAFLSKDIFYGNNFENFATDIDIFPNPAASRMEAVKSLSPQVSADYILYNKITNDNSQIYLDGQMYNSRSGGLVSRKNIKISAYFKGLENELKIWFGEFFNAIDDEWIKKRDVVLFIPPELIKYDKTPFGAVKRSLIYPGLGQSYSGKHNSAYIWAGLESSMLTSVLVSYIGYKSSVSAFKMHTKNYEQSSEQIEFDDSRKSAELDWKKHKDFNNYMIYSGIAAGSIWAANTIHAYIVGPRPKKDIIQEWDIVPAE